MPRHKKAMKDVASCDKLRGGANTPRSGDFRMGKPDVGHTTSLITEHIGGEEPTEGIETS